MHVSMPECNNAYKRVCRSVHMGGTRLKFESWKVRNDTQDASQNIFITFWNIWILKSSCACLKSPNYGYSMTVNLGLCRTHIHEKILMAQAIDSKIMYISAGEYHANKKSICWNDSHSSARFNKIMLIMSLQYTPVTQSTLGSHHACHTTVDKTLQPICSL